MKLIVIINYLTNNKILATGNLNCLIKILQVNVINKILQLIKWKWLNVVNFIWPYQNNNKISLKVIRDSRQAWGKRSHML